MICRLNEVWAHFRLPRKEMYSYLFIVAVHYAIMFETCQGAK